MIFCHSLFFIKIEPLKISTPKGLMGRCDSCKRLNFTISETDNETSEHLVHTVRSGIFGRKQFRFTEHCSVSLIFQ